TSRPTRTDKVSMFTLPHPSPRSADSRSADWRPFQLDGVAVRIIDVDRGACTFRTVATRDRTRLAAVLAQVGYDCRGVKGLHAHAVVIHVAGATRRRIRLQAAIAWQAQVDQVDQRAAGAKLCQPDFRLCTLDRAAQDVAIE